LTSAVIKQKLAAVICKESVFWAYSTNLQFYLTQDEITSAISCLITIDLDSIFHKQNTAGKKSSIAKKITMLLSR
jgi:hypothetical protein